MQNRKIKTAPIVATKKSSPWMQWLIPGFIMLLTILVYSNSINNEFIYQHDDDQYITDNEHIKELSIQNLEAVFTNSYVGLYLPFTMITFMIEYHFFKLDASYYHLVNLILHLANVLLVFLLIFALKPNLMIAGFVSLTFAIHPMHVESVSWLSERKDVLYAFFFLSGSIWYLKFIRKGSYKAYLITLLLFIAALLSKIIAVAFPLLMFLLDWYQGRKITKSTIIEKIPFIILSIIIGLIGIYFTKGAHVQDTSTPVVSWINRLFLISDAVLFYLYKSFFPVDLTIYKYYPVNPTGPLPFGFYFSAIIMVIITVLVILWIKRSRLYRKEIIFGILFFLIPTFFVLQIIPAGRAYAAERYTYLSYIGIFFIVSVFMDHFLNNKLNSGRKYKPVILSAVILLTIGFSYQTYQRNKSWKDSLTLFTGLIEQYPERGHPYLLRGITRYQFGDLNGALNDYNLSISYDPENPQAYSNRASVRGILKDYQGALEDCNKALELSPEYTNAFSNRGLANLFLDNPEAAFNDFSACIRLDPDNPQYYRNRIVASGKLNNVNQIIEDNSRLIEFEPGNYLHYLSRGESHLQSGQPEKAIDDLTMSIKLNPAQYETYLKRGNAYFQLKKYDLAMADFSKLTSIKQFAPKAYFNRGMCFHHLNQPDKACDDWKQALFLGFNDAQTMLTTYCR